MAHAGACAKGNGLMRIYVRAHHVNQFTNLYLHSAPVAFQEKSLTSRRQEKYRQGSSTDAMRCYARASISLRLENREDQKKKADAQEDAWAFANIRECNKRDGGRRQRQSCPTRLRRASVNA